MRLQLTPLGETAAEAVKGAKDIAVEFTTMSKPYNMAGLRVGFVAGNKDMIDYVRKSK